MLISNGGSSSFLENLCGKSQSFTIGNKDNCYIGLSTTEINENGGNVSEPSSSKNYARIEVSKAMSRTYRSVSLGETTEVTHTRRIGNKDDINFNAAVNPDTPESTTSDYAWGTVVSFALFTTATGGVPYAWGKLKNSSAINAKTTPHFLKGRFEICLTEEGTLEAIVTP